MRDPIPYPQSLSGKEKKQEGEKYQGLEERRKICIYEMNLSYCNEYRFVLSCSL